MGIAQYVFVFLSVTSLVVSVYRDGEERDPYSGGEALVGFVIVQALLWWGGFFS